MSAVVFVLVLIVVPIVIMGLFGQAPEANILPDNRTHIWGEWIPSSYHRGMGGGWQRYQYRRCLNCWKTERIDE